MKKHYLSLMFLLLISCLIYGQQTELKFKKGKFKILQFTDLHWVGGESHKVYRDSTAWLMEELIKQEKPDLVVLTGDVVVSWGAVAELKKVVEPMINHKVPYTILFGNHDTETDLTKKEALDVVMSLPYNVTYNADKNISGVGNCALPIKASNGDDNKWVLYMIDSHAYPANNADGVYDWIKFDQIEWYRKESDRFAKEEGRRLPSLAFFHIPLKEYTDAINYTSFVGNRFEGECAPYVNSGLYSSFLEKKDVIGTFVGHDHNNDYFVDLDGKIGFAYGRKTGYAPAYKEVLERGARVIVMNENERSYDSYIRTYNGKEQNYSFEQKGGGINHPVIEGTFIQEFLVAGWDDARWQQEFRMMRDLGMQYLIFAPALNVNEKNEPHYLYPSKNSKRKHKKDLLDTCLKNAQEMGIKVFIGLNMHERWWKVDYTPEWLYAQMEEGNKIADELIAKYKNKYGSTMYGWYWVWEIDNYNASPKEYQKVLTNALNINLDHLNKVTPEMPVMLSPFANHRLGDAKANTELWKNIFAGAHFKNGDIFSPQDCVGAGGLNLEVLNEWIRGWGEAVNTKPGLKYWSNVETFDQRFWASATIDRVVKQMKTVNPYVSKIISFAYSHYNSPGTVNSEFHKAYETYYKTGKLPSIEAPQAPTNLRNIKGKLSWEPVLDEKLVGYNIYKNGELIHSAQAKSGKAPLTFYEDKEYKNSDIYEVTSYNAIGKESERVK